jgi:putative hydrolase of the HAD superfamily
MLTHLVCDLDDTVYPQDNGLWGAIGERINLYMVERLGLPAADVAVRRETYFRSFGTTLNGLMSDFHVDPADYLDFVHDLPLEDYLRPDPELDAMLAGLPVRKSIFTNSDEKHARRVLDRLGIARHFDPIVDIWALDFVNKPQPGAYRVLFDRLQAQPDECVFIEDSLRNLRAARAAGMQTIWITQDGQHSDEVDFVIQRIYEVGPIVHGRR